MMMKTGALIPDAARAPIANGMSPKIIEMMYPRHIVKHSDYFSSWQHVRIVLAVESVAGAARRHVCFSIKAM